MVSGTLPGRTALDVARDGLRRPTCTGYPSAWRAVIGSDGTAWGRDIGPPSSRNTSKGALLKEAQVVFREFGRGLGLPDLRRACLEGRLLRKGTTETRTRVWDALHWRYFAWGPPHWVLSDLAEAATDSTDRFVFPGLLYIHYVRRDRLTFDFVTEKLWPLWRTGTHDVRRDDVIDFLAESGSGQPARWRGSTRVKLAGNILSALRDFGLLAGVQRKKLQRPVVAPEVALHLCRLLDAEGLRGRSLLEARDWHLFLWDIQDTSQALAQLAQRGELRFERSGRTVVLDVPRHPLAEGR
jgi:hypothetical protein